MIIESEIKSLKEEKVNLKDETVESTNPYLPKMYFCGIGFSETVYNFLYTNVKRSKRYRNRY
jgi:tmRNA-binding protein